MKRFVCHIINLLTRIGKPLAVTGIILLLVMLLGTCGSDEISEQSLDMEYTDVEYEEDGSGVTIYLDGIGVPKSRAQRAVTTDIAKMAFDFIEVIFKDGTGSIARASWVLGEPANINNITRSIDYATTFGTNSACMFVGKDDGKVLLGIGKLTNTRGTPAAATATTIDANTRSVTFSIAAIKTGLLINAESTATVNGYTVAADSFNYSYPIDPSGTGTRAGNSFRRKLPPTGEVWYPVYVIPKNVNTTATYTFSFATDPAVFPLDQCLNAIRTVNDNTTGVKPVVQKKTPRYATNGRYEEPRNRIDTNTTVSFNGYNPTNGGPFGTANSPAIPLIFTISSNSGGFLAFNMQIPVFMSDKGAAGKNSGPDAKTWYIRTGIGSEFYSLDDGVSRGGCVFISVDVSETEFDRIEWTWFKGF